MAQIEYWALIISGIAMVLTCVNVLLAFLEFWNRKGIKLIFDVLHRSSFNNGKYHNEFLAYLVNKKSSNICIVAISYIFVADVEKPLIRQIFPFVGETNPALLNGYQASFIHTHYATAATIFTRKEPFYVRIKTSKGIYTIDKRRLPFYKKFWWQKTSVHAIEKLVAEQEKQVIKNAQQTLNIK